MSVQHSNTMWEPNVIIMDPRHIEDRALKKMLRPSDFANEVDIPRARVKRFPSNVGNFRRSASARLPSRQNSFPGGQNGSPFKTPPIDIATLLDEHPPAPKIPISRGIGRSYSNRDETPTPPPQPRRQLNRSGPMMTSANGGGGAGSFLYSGNYNPNDPNQRIITKPVPLARSQSVNVKHAGPRPRPPPPTKPRNPHVNNKVGGLKNPLAGAGVIREEEDVDEVDLRNGGGGFDNWADDLYNNNAVPAVGVGVAGKNAKKAGKGKSVQNSASPQQNWVLAGGPANGVSKKASPREESFGDMAKDVAKDVAKDQAKEALTGLMAEGGINIDPTDLVGGLASGLGAKAGGKLGGKLGKALGNEKLGEDLGEMAGGELGEMAGDMAQDAAMDAAGDLLAGEGIELEPPDPSQLCSKCSVM